MIKSVKIKNIDNTLAMLKREQQKYQRKLKEVVIKLQDLGFNVANAYYSGGVYYAGEYDVEVLKINEGDYKATISAQGNSVLFIEFGTGVMNPDAPEARANLQESSGLVGHGQYGQKRGASEKGWFYRGETGLLTPPGTEWSTKHKGLIHTYGNEATPVMYWTWERVKEFVPMIIKEVLND